MATTPSDPLLPLRNRCNESKSPYVRSHASNPTAWQLWSPSTLALARSTNRLLFISIGYSACHWCHVMATESFSNPRIASLLNTHFIPVKIDREERPDIDKVYMDFLQATSGGGGWPLNVFVTPDLEPIFGGTYWPGPGSERASMAQGAGFEDIIARVGNAWDQQEQRCRESAKQITAQLREFAQEGTLSGPAGGRNSQGEDNDDDLDLELLEEAYQHYAAKFDNTFGGFGSAPKFPTPSHLSFLLRLGAWNGAVRDVVGEEEVENAKAMAVKTLENMANGGIKDQIGNGLARYSVTRDWSLPHFEKMLYDNAQLLSLYLDAYLTTSSPLFLSTLHDIARYLTTPPILSPTGAFHASEDADSAPSPYETDTHKEGAFYVWTLPDFRRAINDETLSTIASTYWNLRPDGNVSPRYDVQGELEGQNTLSVSCTLSSLASKFQISESDAEKAIAKAREALLSYRDRERPRPALDDKILVSWNGLAISALSRTAAALRATDPQSSAAYLSAAVSAATFIARELYSPETGLLTRVYRKGPGSPGTAFADDYAFLIAGLLDLYEAGFDDEWLSWAETLQKTQLSLFFDASLGGFFGTSDKQTDVLIRSKDAMDNAEPSANAVSAGNLFRLAAMLGDEGYATLARKTVRAFEVEMVQHPGLFTGLMSGIVCARLGLTAVVVSGPDSSEEVQTALEVLRGSVRPGVTVVRIGGGAGKDAWVRKRSEVLGSVDGGREMVQVCEGTTCRIVGAEGLREMLGGKARA